MMKNNSYLVLGLDCSATQQEIQKRAKDILNLLKIDETPSYETDLPYFDNFRNEQSVKQSLGKLTNPSDKIHEYFFWFDLHDNIDQSAFDLAMKGDYQFSIQLWEFEAKKCLSYSHKKNLALLMLCVLEKVHTPKLIEKSVSLWHELIYSESFWISFGKSFAINDDVGISNDLIAKYRSQIPAKLSDFYTSLKQRHSDDIYIRSFGEKFSDKGKKLETEELVPLLASLNASTEILKKMNISADGIIDDNEKATLASCIAGIQECLQKVSSLGYYSDSQTLTVRDHAAEAIRLNAIDIYNNIGEKKIPEDLLKKALTIVGTETLKEKILEDLRIFENNTYLDSVLGPIIALRKSGKEYDALLLVEKEEQQHKSETEILEILSHIKKACVYGVILEKYQAARQAIDHADNNSQLDDAKRSFFELNKFITDYIDLFSFNKKALYDRIHRAVDVFKTATMDSCGGLFEECRKYFIDLSKENFKDAPEEHILIALADSNLYPVLADCLKEIRFRNPILKVLYNVGGIGVFIYGLGLILLAIAFFYRRSKLISSY